jgi:hypothetical protein
MAPGFEEERVELEAAFSGQAEPAAEPKPEPEPEPAAEPLEPQTNTDEHGRTRTDTDTPEQIVATPEPEPEIPGYVQTLREENGALRHDFERLMGVVKEMVNVQRQSQSQVAAKPDEPPPLVSDEEYEAAFADKHGFEKLLVKVQERAETRAVERLRTEMTQQQQERAQLAEMMAPMEQFSNSFFEEHKPLLAHRARVGEVCSELFPKFLRNPNAPIQEAVDWAGLKSAIADESYKRFRVLRVHPTSESAPKVSVPGARPPAGKVKSKLEQEFEEIEAFVRAR